MLERTVELDIARPQSEEGKSLFELAAESSGLWLPSLLHELAKLPPSFCRADGCSIFLIHGAKPPRLKLAATTRREVQDKLFRGEYTYSYSVDAVRLRNAADDYVRDKTTTNDAGLTGWVAAFKRPLLVNNPARPVQIPPELHRLLIGQTLSAFWRRYFF